MNDCKGTSNIEIRFSRAVTDVLKSDHYIHNKHSAHITVYAQFSCIRYSITKLQGILAMHTDFNI